MDWPIVAMYVFALMLVPVMSFSLYAAFDGDRWRAQQEAEAAAAKELPPVPAPTTLGRPQSTAPDAAPVAAPAQPAATGASIARGA